MLQLPSPSLTTISPNQASSMTPPVPGLSHATCELRGHKILPSYPWPEVGNRMRSHDAGQ